MEMTDLNGSQRLRIAKLRLALPTPFGTVGQPACRGVPAMGRPAALLRPLPAHAGFAPGASRRAVRS
jgi:hypothetical protein